MKFKLQATHDDGTVITHEFKEDVWYAALDNFVKFLRGNGYFVNQVIEFIFGKGFDVVSPYTIQDFINTATSISNGVDGLTMVS